MSRRVIRPRADVCHLCEFLTGRQSTSLPLTRHPLRKAFNPSRTFTAGRGLYSQDVRNTRYSEAPTSRPSATSARDNGMYLSEAQLEKLLQDVKTVCNTLLMQEKVPSEKDTISVLARCKAAANSLSGDPPSPSGKKKSGAASALLSLDDSSAKKVAAPTFPLAIRRMIDDLSKMAYSIVKYPPVFITSEVLDLYVDVQSTLRKPETFPEVFKLYANKPLPEEGSSPVRYSQPKPNKVANAIPLHVADRALQAAITAKQLVVAMDIIEASYTTIAAHRAKFIRKGLLPATGLAVMPIAAWTIASQLAILQTTMDTAMATNVAFAGILAYVGFTATVGVVAVTTANDQMDRVTWAQGVPLRERWMREEERAAIDKVAGSWGFREIWRRGEEEGEDWDALREWIGRKAMMLDRVELMEGME